jgi:glycosyltransferase involved in cell wall biosynthesis
MILRENLKIDTHSFLPEISVIVPFYGKKHDLLNCINGLQDQDFKKPFETIIVESGNYPEIKKFISTMPNVTSISSDSIMYPGKARNIGAKNSAADFLAFTDADCVPYSNWLSKIYSSLNSGNDIVIGPVINLYPFHPIASVDNLLQFPDFQRHRPSKNIMHFPACNLGITKKLFIKTGGFPDNYLTGEDVIFSEIAIKICKGKIEFNHHAIVQHSGRKSILGFIKHNEILGFYRGYLKLKIPSGNKKFLNTSFYSIFFGFKRFIYILIRTLQWNPAGILRIVFYFPLLILGLSAWTKGFWKGNQKFSIEN